MAPCVRDLPAEIWLSEVVPWVEPFDVLFLSQTCRTFHSMLTHKSVWAEILRSACNLLGLFLASYPIDDMSLLEIQQAATGPRRWDALVRRRAVPFKELGTTPPLPVVASRSLETFSEGYFNVCEVRSHIVPGGRFFVVIRIEMGNRIVRGARLELWDLGVPMRRTNVAPKLVALRKVARSSPGYTGGDLYVTTSKGNPDELRVAVSSQVSETAIEIAIFSIFPSQHLPGFEPIASARFDGVSESTPGGFMHGNLIALRAFRGNSLLLWDFVDSMITRVPLKVNILNTQTGLGEIFVLTDRHLIRMAGDVSMWSLARLRSFGEPGPPRQLFRSSTKACIDLLPEWTIPYPSPVTWAGGALTMLEPVRCTIGNSPSITIRVVASHRNRWPYHPMTFYQHTLIASSELTGPPFRFTSGAVEQWTLPPGYLVETSFVRLRNNGVRVPCITLRSPQTPPSTVTYMSPHTVTGASAHNPRRIADANEMKEVPGTLLERLKPLTSCSSSGRFIYHTVESGIDSLRLVDYL